MLNGRNVLLGTPAGNRTGQEERKALTVAGRMLVEYTVQTGHNPRRHGPLLHLGSEAVPLRLFLKGQRCDACSRRRQHVADAAPTTADVRVETLHQHVDEAALGQDLAAIAPLPFVDGGCAVDLGYAIEAGLEQPPLGFDDCLGPGVRLAFGAKHG